MSEELAFKILKQADIDYGCDNCPRTNKNKSCIGCLDKSKEILIKSYEKLQQENKQLKEQLENKIDLYEDTISYQLGYDSAKALYEKVLTELEEWLKEENTYSDYKDITYRETMGYVLDKIQELRNKYEK